MVTDQGTLLTERLLTDVTLVRFFASVYTVVTDQNVPLTERLPTDVTLVRFFASVVTAVNGQGSPSSETLPADITAVQLSRVHPSMVSQTACCVRRILAPFTFVSAFLIDVTVTTLQVPV